MRICVLIATYEGSSSPLKDVDPVMDPTPWLDGHAVTLAPIFKAGAAARIEALAAEGYDLFINLCDGGEDEDTAGVDVVFALERLGVPFTGAGSDCFDLHKVRTKEHLRRAGIPTPAGVLARGDGDIDEAAGALRFPLITKHPSGYCSVGMTRDSRVEDAAALRREARRMIGSFGSVLIEEFIEGREATVLVVEDADDPAHPRVYDPILCHFPPGETFKHEILKWQAYAGLRWVPCDEPALSDELRARAMQGFLALGLRGYARADFRIDHRGVPFCLEWNSNCGIFYPRYTAGSADEILLQSPDGHRRFLDLIIRAAFARQAEPEHTRRRAPPDIAVRGRGVP